MEVRVVMASPSRCLSSLFSPLFQVGAGKIINIDKKNREKWELIRYLTSYYNQRSRRGSKLGNDAPVLSAVRCRLEKKK